MQIKAEVKKYQGRDWLYIRPRGELDMAAAEGFKKTIVSGLLRSGCRTLWLDMQDVTFIDSSGLGVILGRYRELAPLSGSIRVTGADPLVYRLLVASGMQNILKIEKPRAGKEEK